MLLFLIFWGLLLDRNIKDVNGLIGYDCAGPNLNYTRTNLRYVEPCLDQRENVVTTSEEIQLLETSDTFSTRVRSCLVKITRVVAYCGHSSHNSIVEGGMAEYIYIHWEDLDVLKHTKQELHHFTLIQTIKLFS